MAKYENYRRKTLNLIPSENLLSPEVLGALSSTMSGRYAGKPESYGGSKIFHEIWEKCEETAKSVFRCRMASVVPISGHIAGMMALDGCAKRGETIAALSSENGGYKGYTNGHIPSIYGFNVVCLPFDRESHSIKEENAISLISKDKPNVVVLGATVFLFPHPVKAISETVHSYGGRVIFDGSHVMGLIAGRRFQDPLSEGADLLLGSTHKTLFGPQGGIILSNDEELLGKIESKYLYSLIDNFHLNRVASLGIALEEVKKHGENYAYSVIENAKTLGRELNEFGLPVAGRSRRYTESHQILLSYGENGDKIRETLESNGIIVDSRVCLGSNEVTRRGMGPKQMTQIANLVNFSISSPSDRRIRSQVFALASRYRRIKYSL